MRRIRKKFKRPRVPWDSATIEEQKGVLREYGLRRKKEIWIAQEMLRNFRRRARELIAERDEEKTEALLDKLVKLGLLKKGQGLDDVLALTVNNILDRRLQTVVFRKGTAGTVKQARQHITHGHVAIGGRRTAFPSYIVQADEESKITLQKTKTGTRGGSK